MFSFFSKFFISVSWRCTRSNEIFLNRDVHFRGFISNALHANSRVSSERGDLHRSFNFNLSNSTSNAIVSRRFTLPRDFKAVFVFINGTAHSALVECLPYFNANSLTYDACLYTRVHIEKEGTFPFKKRKNFFQNILRT